LTSIKHAEQIFIGVLFEQIAVFNCFDSLFEVLSDITSGCSLAAKYMLYCTINHIISILNNSLKTFHFVNDKFLWKFTLVNAILFAFNYWSLIDMARTFAASMNLWASIILLLSAPMALIASILAILKPIKIIQAIINCVLVIIYTWFWFMFLT
jgi:hypothetical protein